MDKIINIAVVAHVDTGKSTLIDGLLKQNGAFKDNEEVAERIMDSNEIEKERGITITAKNCSIRYKDYKINIVDTPGHADFSSEVERIIKTVDTVILLVDSAEGPMPQTRFVLKEALQNNLKPILFINKIDKKDARPLEVVDMTFNLFIELGASDEQLDFPILYGSAKDAWVVKDIKEEGQDLTLLLDTIISSVEPFKGDINDNLQLQITDLGYDDYIGRLGIGRINKGKITNGEVVNLVRNNGGVENFKITKLFTYEGIKRKETAVCYYGDIVVIAGCSNVSIGDTICEKGVIDPLPKIIIEEPTLAMNFLVNSSPFAGQSGKFLTNRDIKKRLDLELETNVGLKVSALPNADGFKVSGRGELHLAILLEKMRREGYELLVSKPEVIFKEENNKKLEPYERVVISVPNDYLGTVINSLNQRKGSLISIENKQYNYNRVEYLMPTRGLIGYRSGFITDTKGEGIIVRSFDSYRPYAGEIISRKNGVMVSIINGKTFGYSLWNLTDRGTMIVEPATDVYMGMIVGICNKEKDLNVNPCKNKELTNTRSAHADEAIVLNKAKKFTLEEALEFIEDDEYIEITPKEVRLRKKILDPKKRYKDINKM